MAGGLGGAGGVGVLAVVRLIFEGLGAGGGVGEGWFGEEGVQEGGGGGFDVGVGLEERGGSGVCGRLAVVVVWVSGCWLGLRLLGGGEVEVCWLQGGGGGDGGY